MENIVKHVEMDVPYRLAITAFTGSAFTIQNFIRLYELDISISRIVNVTPSRVHCEIFNDLYKKEMDKGQLKIVKEI